MEKEYIHKGDVVISFLVHLKEFGPWILIKINSQVGWLYNKKHVV